MIDFYKNTISGICAGTIEVLLMQPTIYYKNASQQKLGNTINPSILYRGLTMSVINMSVLTGTQFPISNIISKMILQDNNRTLTDKEKIVSGFGAGLFSGIICAPMELVMIQQQKYGGNIFNTPLRIKNKLMRGFSTSSMREGIYTTGYIGLTPVLSKYFKKNYNIENNISKISGAICAGFISSTLSQPIDTIKTCMQGDIEQKKYTTTINTARTLIRENGLIRLYRGWGWRTGRIMCAMFIINECKERFSIFF